MELKLVDAKLLDLTKIKPFAFNLAGGGKAGAYECGALAAFAQIGVLENSEYIAGTSTGGLNTGTYSLWGGIEPGEDGNIDLNIPQPWWASVDVWEEIEKNSDIYKGSIGSGGIKGFFEGIGAGAGFLFGKRSILDPTPLYKKLDKIFGDITLKEAAEKWKIDIILTAMDLNTTNETFFTSFNPDTQNIKLAEVLKATSGIPGVFRTVPVAYPLKLANGKVHWFVDGGLAANNPFISCLKYNVAFPDKVVKKIIIIFCYPDEYTDTGLEITGMEDDKEYKSYKSAILRSIPCMLNGSEQIAEMIINDKCKNSDYDVLAISPKETPGDPLDFSNVQKLIQDGYDAVAVEGKGWSYKDDAMINIADFLKR